eukprot:713067-Rhodomonas_salina.3
MESSSRCQTPLCGGGGGNGDDDNGDGDGNTDDNDGSGGGDRSVHSDRHAVPRSILFCSRRRHGGGAGVEVRGGCGGRERCMSGRNSGQDTVTNA